MKNKNVIIPLILIVVILIFGIAGYQLIEEWDFGDAFYMTIITLTTTGFREVHRLSDGGRLFTSLLLVSGVGVFA